MPLVQLARGLTVDPVDHTAVAHDEPIENLIRAAPDVADFMNAQELDGAIAPAFRQPDILGKDCDIRDHVIWPRDTLILGEAPIQYIELASDLLGESVDDVLDFYRHVGIEVPEATEIRRAAGLPEESRQAFSAPGGLHQQECAKFLR